jgi:hypothetical protein
MTLVRRLPSVFLAALLFLAAGPAAHASPVVDSYNQDPGPGNVLPLPGCCTWAPDTIGWYWTPQQTFGLKTVETILIGLLSGVNNDFNLTVTLFTDRPAAGGTALGSATFNPGAFDPADPPWHGKAFDTPILVTGGTPYFVGFSGWNNSTPPNDPNVRGGINWVNQPGFPNNLPPGVRFLSQAYIGASFETPIGTGSTTTAAPVIKFVGDTVVPEPATGLLLGVGLLLLARSGSRG